jgi:hypothetical protein
VTPDLSASRQDVNPRRGRGTTITEHGGCSIKFRDVAPITGARNPRRRFLNYGFAGGVSTGAAMDTLAAPELPVTSNGCHGIEGRRHSSGAALALSRWRHRTAACQSSASKRVQIGASLTWSCSRIRDEHGARIATCVGLLADASRRSAL